VLSFVTAVALIVVQATALGSIAARTFLGGATLADHTGLVVVAGGAAVLVRAAATWATQVLAHRTAARVKSGLRRAVVARLARRPPGETDEDTGALASALTDGIDALDGTFGGYLPALLAGIIVPVTIVVYVVTIDPTSAVVLLVTLPLIPIFMVLIGLAARAATRRRFRALTGLSGQLLTVLQGLTVVHVARSGDRVGAAVRDGAERLRRTTLETLRVAFLSALALELLAALSVATVAVIAGVRLAEATGIGFEPVLIALLLAPEAFCRCAGRGTVPRQRGRRGRRRSAPGPARGRRGGSRRRDGGRRGGRRWPGPGGRRGGGAAGPAARATRSGSGRPVPTRTAPRPRSTGVDLELVPGERLAILGASGAGKTTLAAVLLGLRPPDAGRSWSGATELADLDPAAWHARLPGSRRPRRRCVARCARWSRSAARPGPPTPRWGGAARRRDGRRGGGAAGGLDTRIGAGGRGLSAGQRRRLAIARALLRPAGLVVLDEPTGDLDVDAEQAVRGAIEPSPGHRTVVV
jgi:ABC-type transport system involved in cytochrome bd biosynthesis fused ATPase/permease subunit